MYLTWIQGRIGDGKSFIRALGQLINVNLPDAFGPVGQPGDPDKIVSVAQGIATIYREALEWGQRMRTANVSVQVRPVTEAASRILDDTVEKIYSYGPKILASVEATLAAGADERRSVDATLTIEASNLPVIEERLKELKARLDSDASRPRD